MARKLISRSWTPEDDATLLALIEDKTPIEVIARSLKRTRQATYSRARVLRNGDPIASTETPESHAVPR
jgi:hypothetical protein